MQVRYRSSTQGTRAEINSLRRAGQDTPGDCRRSCRRDIHTVQQTSTHEGSQVVESKDMLYRRPSAPKAVWASRMRWAYSIHDFVPILYQSPGIVGLLAGLAGCRINNMRVCNTVIGSTP